MSEGRKDAGREVEMEDADVWMGCRGGGVSLSSEVSREQEWRKCEGQV